MTRKFFNHTGDVGVRVSGESLEALFEEAALAFTDTVTDLHSVIASSAQSIRIASPGLDELLVDWLEELLYRFEVRNLLVAGADITIGRTDRPAGGWHLEGSISGEPLDVTKHPTKVLIKGITYHHLHVDHAAGQWRTSVVFDI